MPSRYVESGPPIPPEGGRSRASIVPQQQMRRRPYASWNPRHGDAPPGEDGAQVGS